MTKLEENEVLMIKSQDVFQMLTRNQKLCLRSRKFVTSKQRVRVVLFLESPVALSINLKVYNDTNYILSTQLTKLFLRKWWKKIP